MHAIVELLAAGNFAYYAYDDYEDRENLLGIMHIVFNSCLDEFTDYVRWFLVSSGLEKEIHNRDLKEGRTKTELYAFLEKLDWPRIFELCRRHSDDGSVARLFQKWTEFDYAAERERYVKAWDGTPIWPMENGKYLR